MGINNGKDLTSKGGELNTRINPNPNVTADVPNGNIRSGSRTLPHRFRSEMIFAAKNPKNKAIPTVKRPKYSELNIASMGGM